MIDIASPKNSKIYIYIYTLLILLVCKNNNNKHGADR